MEILKIYDNNGETFDRYTVVVNIKANEQMYECLGLSDNPESPQGFSQWSSCMIGNHLGKEICFDELPKHIQEHIKARLSE